MKEYEYYCLKESRCFGKYDIKRQVLVEILDFSLYLGVISQINNLSHHPGRYVISKKAYYKVKRSISLFRENICNFFNNFTATENTGYLIGWREDLLPDFYILNKNDKIGYNIKLKNNPLFIKRCFIEKLCGINFCKNKFFISKEAGEKFEKLIKNYENNFLKLC